jgi:hypothetical protein
MLEAIRSPEASFIARAARLHIPEIGIAHSRRRRRRRRHENLKSYTFWPCPLIIKISGIETSLFAYPQM